MDAFVVVLSRHKKMGSFTFLYIRTDETVSINRRHVLGWNLRGRWRPAVFEIPFLPMMNSASTTHSLSTFCQLKGWVLIHNAIEKGKSLLRQQGPLDQVQLRVLTLVQWVL